MAADEHLVDFSEKKIDAVPLVISKQKESLKDKINRLKDLEELKAKSK